jgi:alkylhydroperoxidase family enzyme
LLQDDALVQEVLAGARTSRLSAAEKALFAFLDKVNDDCARIGPPDIQALHEAGWTDEAIYDAVSVCALFNFFNRWIDATGVHPMSDEAHRMSARRMAQSGYVRSTE